MSETPKKHRKESLRGYNDDTYDVRLLCGSSNTKLARDVATELGVSLEPVECGRFADGEVNIQINKNVRGSDVFLIQPTCPPHINDNIIELLLMIHTLQLSSAKRITAVVPYYGYARQDRKTKARVPISAAAIANLIETMGPHRVVTLDLHCGQIQGFFRNIPVDNLFAENEFIEKVRELNIDPAQIAVVSPDAGGVPRARRVADKIGESTTVVTILKRRVQANKIESMQLVGEVDNKVCFIFDDIIDTAGTICKAAEMIKENGAVEVYGVATHGVFSGPALERLTKSVMKEVWVTDSIPMEENLKSCPKLQVLSIAPLLAEVIVRLHKEKSLSKLFTGSNAVRMAEQNE